MGLCTQPMNHETCLPFAPDASTAQKKHCHFFLFFLLLGLICVLLYLSHWPQWCPVSSSYFTLFPLVDSNLTTANCRLVANNSMSYFEPSVRYTNPGSLCLDLFGGHTDDEASHGSPSSTIATNSPNSTIHAGSASLRHPQGNGIEDEKEPSSGPQRQSASGVKSDKEKRKRSRVTPEQLVRLEQYFAMDRSPTASRRREISDILGMQERQTQIWFQNRRAKAKLQDGKESSRGASTELTRDTPREISSNFGVDLQGLIYEDQSVTLIPCTDLTIGTWHRIASPDSKHDLIAYISEARRCLNWFIHSEGYGFKMEIPFETVTDVQFQPAGPASGLASFFLSQPPLFFIETVSSPQVDGIVSRRWKRCSDWTQGHQATEVLYHRLTGSAAQLVQIIRILRTSKHLSERSTTYHTEPPILRPMEIPPPPLVGLNNVGFLNEEVDRPGNVSYMDNLRKRSCYSALETHHTPEGDLGPTPQSAPVEVKHSLRVSADNRSNHPDFSTSMFNNCRWTSNQGAMLPLRSVDSSRSYTTQAPCDPNHGPRSLQDFQPGADHPSVSDSTMLYGTSSPRFLTTPSTEYVPNPSDVPPAYNRYLPTQSPLDRTCTIYEFDEQFRNRRSH